MRVFSRRYIIGIIAALLLLPTVSLLAYTPYTAEISTQDTSAGARAYYPVLLPLNIAGAINLGMLDADGLYSSLEDGATPVKYLLTGDKVAYVIPALGAGGSVLYTLTLGESSPQTGFPIIVGDGGYITTADNAALEPGDTFELIYDGYVDTSAGVSKYLANKEGAFSLYVSGEGEITASIICENTNFPAYEGYKTDYSSSAASTSVDIPACDAGDYLVMFVDSDYAPSYPEGWSLLASGSGYYINYKVADGTEGSSITITFGSSYTKAVYMTYCISGADGIEVSSIATGSSTTPDPPSFTPTHGLGNYLWLPSGSIARATTLSSGPSGYSNSRYYGNLTYYGVYAATKTSTASTENPEVFTLGYSEDWATFTTALYSSAVTFDLTASSISNGEHKVEVSADSTNLYLYIDDVLEDSAALGGNSILDNSSNWVFMQNNVSPYIDYISYSVSGTPQFTYEPTSLISGTTLVDEVNSFDGMITWGTNDDLTLSSTGFESTGVYEPGGGSSGTLPVVIEAPTTAPDMFIDPTAAMTNTLPYQDLVNPAATSLDWSSRTLYTILAIIVAIGLSVGVTIATGSLLLGATAAGIILLVGWNMSIISFWVVLAYAMMVLTYLVIVRSM